MTIEEMMKAQGWKVEGEIICSRYCIEICITMFSNDAFQETPSGWKTVDVSGRDISHLNGLDEALNLVGKRLHGGLTFKEIRDKIKPIDLQQEKDFAVNVDMAELSATLAAAIANAKIRG